MLDLPELKSTLKKYDITPKKFLGQNFLVDRDVVEDIITVCGFKNFDWVMEIGAGLGALTCRLAREVKHIIAIEKDRGVCLALNDMLKGFGNVRTVCDDFLELDLGSVLVEAPSRVKAIGNLPYYITTPIIERLIENRNISSGVCHGAKKRLPQGYVPVRRQGLRFAFRYGSFTPSRDPS
jgi:16S rRNA (adenine1518-N6/adenine1519-N6)-dimethyltransferase